MTNEDMYLRIKEQLDAGRDIADILNVCYKRKRIPYTYNSEFENTEIESLELSVRSFNCLKRAGIGTLGELMERIDGMDDLMQIRNLGRKSAEEVLDNLLRYRYQTYGQERKERFIRRIIEENEHLFSSQ